MNPLLNRRILVTRPLGQNAALARLLESRGAHPFELPLFAIEAHGEASEHREVLRAAHDWTGWIFTSINAAHFAAELETGPWPCVFAIGHATAQAVRDRGHTVTQLVPGASTSEALLEHSGLQDIADSRFLLCTGLGGRKLIETALMRRGAQVQRLELYRRTAIEYPAADIEQALQAADAIVCTSGEGLERLHALAPPALHAHLHSRLLVAPSARVVELARRLGFVAAHAPALASDESWVDCLAQWLEEP
ncbi:MAG: uroporphyrinogen-III synthase [Panacagrimonas sp.]